MLVSKYSEPKLVMRFSQKELENDLKPLGLYRQRALALRKIAETITNDYCSLIPTDQKTLSKIPHVGLYISSAVACFCHGTRTAIVDSNVARILTRVRGLQLPKDAREKWVWNLAEEMLPDAMWREYSFGLLDLGALICRKVPLCDICPVNNFCVYGQKCLELRD
jgi:A/G-specific adenine glycosylase